VSADKLKYAIGNSSSTTLSGSVANDATTMTITSDTNFNAKNGEGMVVIDEGTANEEFAYSTGKTGTTLATPLANRGLEGGSASAHDANATVKGIITSTMWNDLVDSLANVVSKTTGALDTTKVVDLTTAQTLTNKTLVSPVITTSFDGWVALGAATYEASDDPTYTLSFASDMTGILSAGMRLKVTDSTVQYFIITGVGAYSGGKTIITLYGGTDYNLSGGALTNPYYSVQKIPQGFPLDPAKWSQVLVPLGSGNQTSPTTNTWYNTGSNSLVIPIGCWKVSYSAYPIGQKNSATDVNVEVTLSTANNSESDTTMTRMASISGAAGNINIGASLYADRFLTLTTKTTYYFNLSSMLSTYLKDRHIPLLYNRLSSYIVLLLLLWYF